MHKFYMAQQQHVLCSGGGGGGGRSKSGKPKKVPQRGLGVAQLEKIRIEEQRKKEALQTANEAVDIHFPGLCSCPDLTPFPSPNALHPSISVPAPVRVGKDLLECGNWPSRIDGEKDLGFAFWPPYGSNVPLLVPRRSCQFQHPCSNVVKASPGIPPPSTVLCSLIEPPSNQSPCGHSYASLQAVPEEQKIVGMKRPYPFPLDNMAGQATSLPGHFHPSTYSVAPLSRSDELPSCSGGHTMRKEPRNIYAKESPSNSSLLPSESKQGNQKLNADFLTLAPPNSNSVNDHHESLELRLPSTQENLKSPTVEPTGPNRVLEQQQPISLLPVKLQMDSRMGAKGEFIDLNLKL